MANKTSTLTYAYNSGVFLKANISPSNATNKDVTWTSSDTNVAKVSKSGHVTAVKGGAGYEDGVVRTVTITARTSDGGYTDTWTIYVKPSGTIVTSVTPDKTSIGATGGKVSLTIGHTDLGNYKSGVTVTSDVAFSNKTNYNLKSGDVVSFNVPENYGAERTLTVNVHGNFTGEDGISFTLTQAGSTKVKELKYWDCGQCYASGEFYHTSETTFSGALHFVCATGGADNILSNITISDSFIHVSGVAHLVDSYYDGTSTYWTTVTCDANTTGKLRAGYINFPGDIKFKITQDA